MRMSTHLKGTNLVSGLCRAEELTAEPAQSTGETRVAADERLDSPKESVLTDTK